MQNKLFLISLLALGACAKNNAQPTSTETLAAKPAVEVLNEKYDRADLVCRLTVEENGRIHTVDSFRLDLKKDPKISGTVRLLSKERRNSLVVDIELKDAVVQPSVALNNGRARYAMKNTITVPFLYSYTRGSEEGGRAYADSIYERVPYLVMQATSGNVTQSVDCVLDTKLKPAFAGDFQRL